MFYDQFVVVEGDTEETLIPHFYEVINGSTLENDNIRIINLGGKDKIAQNALILNGILGEFKKSDSTVYFIMDSDAQYKLTAHEIDKYKPTFIGRQDIEDSINSSVWENIIRDNLEESIRLNKDEIEGIIKGIRVDGEEESKKKFYPKMISSIKKKLRDLGRDDFEIVDAALPSKGADSGRLIIQYIDNVTHIDAKLSDTLKQIKASS